MTLRHYLILMGIGTLISFGAVLLILTMVNPEQTSMAVFAVFYASVFLAITGAVSIIGFTLRVLLLKKQLFLSKEVAVSFRQAVLVAALMIGVLLLQSHNLFSWWTGLLMMLAMSVFEAFFISTRTRIEH